MTLPESRAREAIRLPDLGLRGESVRVSAWFVDEGDAVREGDRVVELLIAGLTFDISATISGRVSQIERGLDAPVSEGDVLGWIETDLTPAPPAEAT